MRRYIVLALLTTMFVGCVKDQTKDLAVEVGADKIYVTMEQCENRVQLNSQKQTVWTKNDKMAVYTAGGVRFYTFDGETGDRSGSFTRTGEYTANINTAGMYYALHSADCTSPIYGHYQDGSLAIFSTLPHTQYYLEGSYDEGSNVMVGESSDGENFALKNVLGYLRLSITGNKPVNNIKLTSNDGSAIVGQIAFRASDVSVWQFYDLMSPTITLNCGDGVLLSETPTEFYFALPPVTFVEGFNVEVNFTDGSQFIQRTSQEVAITRNTIQPMDTFKTNVDDSEYQRIYIYHTGTEVAAPLMTVGGNASIDWGDGNVSLLNQFTSYTYTDGAPSHVITIKALGAENLTMPNMKGVTKIDLSNF